VKPVLLAVAITMVIGSLIASHPIAAQQRTAGKRPERREIVAGPALESATENTAIIKWTVDKGGGTRKHVGLVRYGTDPRNLDRTARSPNRLIRSLPGMTYRVRIYGLTPGTTYYYAVDAALADGVPFGLKSPVNRFTTLPNPRAAPIGSAAAAPF
jgi:phosphodiesterase/alkaline phosphatase D-like protein